MSDLQGPRIPGEERSSRRGGLTPLRIIGALIILALLAVLIPLACQAFRGSGTEEASQGGSQEEETTTSSSQSASGSSTAGGAEEAPAASAEISSLEDQSGDGRTLTIGSATISGTDGWIAIHRDDGNGSPQVPQSIGQAPLREGENSNVLVTLDEPVSSSQTLHAMIHSEDPVDGRYTFPNGDPPVEVSGEVVDEPLRYTVGAEGAGAPLPRSGGFNVLAVTSGAVVLLVGMLVGGRWLLLIRRSS
jgi:cytoskeletal protein RodZ